METFLKYVGEFFSQLGYSIMAGFYYIYTVISEWVKSVIDGLSIPLMPSRSKILNYTYISGSLFLVFLAYVIYINIKTYNLFVKDKKNAVEKRSRIREDTLFKYCILGGSLGGFVGMRTAHHKTQKPSFVIGISVLLVVQLLLFSFVCGFFGFWIYLS